MKKLFNILLGYNPSTKTKKEIAIMSYFGGSVALAVFSICFNNMFIIAGAWANAFVSYLVFVKANINIEE